MTFNLIQAQVWVQKSNLPTGARVNTLGFSDGTYGFISLGNTSLNSNVLKDCWKYDPGLDQWTQMPDFPASPRKNSIVFVIDSMAYVGLGHNGSSYYQDMYSFNMNSHLWDTIAAYPGNGARNVFASSCNGKGYVGGGQRGTQEDDFYSYDPITNQWTQLNDLTFGNRASGIAFTIADTVYFGLGYNGSVGFTDLWGYDVNAQIWLQKASIPAVNRLKSTVFVVNNRAVVGGGFSYNSTTDLSDYFEYDPIIDQWDTVATFAAAKRSSATAFSIGNYGYLMAGASPVYLNDLWQYGNVSTGSIANTFNKEGLNLYPNPVNDKLNILKQGSYRLQLYSIKGELILESFMRDKFQLDLSEVPEGIYLLIGKSGDSTFEEKIIVN